MRAGAAASPPMPGGDWPPGPQYLYGLTTSGADVPPGLHGTGHPAGRVMLVRHGAIAAIVSGVRAGQPLCTPADARAHASVLTVMAEAVSVLPMRFGAVMADGAAIVAELLTPHHDTLAATLARLDGHQQFTIKGTYIGQAALREVLAAEPEVMRLRRLLAGREINVYSRESIRLGELVARALERKRMADLQVLAGALQPHATALAPRTPSAADDAIDAAFLVLRRQRPAFEQAAEELARHWRSRIRLRLLGPLAPYDFTGTIPGWG